MFPNTYAQSAGVTEVASGGTLQASPTLTGGVLRGAGQVSGNVTNTSGTVRPGGAPGTLTVTGLHPGCGRRARGRRRRQPRSTTTSSVGGAASLDGTLAVVKGAGFVPQPTDTFPFLTSASRTGAFAALTGRRPAGREALRARLSGRARLRRAPGRSPTDLVVTDCDDPALATVTEVTGDLVVDGVAGCDAVELPSLVEVAGDLTITGLEEADVIDLAGSPRSAGASRSPAPPPASWISARWWLSRET